MSVMGVDLRIKQLPGRTPSLKDACVIRRLIQRTQPELAFHDPYRRGSASLCELGSKHPGSRRQCRLQALGQRLFDIRLLRARCLRHCQAKGMAICTSSSPSINPLADDDPPRHQTIPGRRPKPRLAPRSAPNRWHRRAPPPPRPGCRRSGRVPWPAKSATSPHDAAYKPQLPGPA